MIGAGIAGLTAARDLAVDGYDVAILEARERIGGRIWTSHELGLPADLGHRGFMVSKTTRSRGSPGGTPSRSSAPTSPV